MYTIKDHGLIAGEFVMGVSTYGDFGEFWMFFLYFESFVILAHFQRHDCE